MGYFWKIITAAALAVFTNWAVKQAHFFNLGHHHHTQWPGPCKEIKGIVNGAEDGEMISGDLAILSSGICFTNKEVKNCRDNMGKMFLFDFNQPDSGAKEIPIVWKSNVKQQKQKDFHPHGISVWHGQSEIRIFVVSHEPNYKEIVEIFSFDEKAKKLIHKESVTIPEVILFNDVKATGPQSFYFTNYQQFVTTHIMMMLEFLMSLKLGWVGHYDGNTGKTQVVATDIMHPNGIQMSPDGKYVYVSNIGEKAVDVFKRHKNNSLDLIKRVHVNTIVDNLSLEPTNTALWLGCVPITYQALQYGSNPSTFVSGQILKLALKDGIPTDNIRQIFGDNGELVHGISSVGIYHKSKLLIGSVMNKAAICDVLYE